MHCCNCFYWQLLLLATAFTGNCFYWYTQFDHRTLRDLPRLLFHPRPYYCYCYYFHCNCYHYHYYYYYYHDYYYYYYHYD